MKDKSGKCKGKKIDYKIKNTKKTKFKMKS